MDEQKNPATDSPIAPKAEEGTQPWVAPVFQQTDLKDALSGPDVNFDLVGYDPS